MKRKQLAWMLAAVMALSLLSGCGGSKEQELNIYTWEDYIPDNVVAEFEEATGIRINYTNFETNEQMLSVLENADGGDYDLILASDYIIDIAIKEGLVGKLDKEKIPNLANIDPLYQGFFYDQNDEYTVPYAPGIPLIVYDPSRVTTEITGYESLWDPSLEDSVGIMDTERVITGIALKIMGESFNTENADMIRQAGKMLLDLAPNVRVLSNDQTQDYLLSGDVSVAFLFTSQVVLALQGNPDLKVVYPKEGLGFGCDALFVPANAPHADNAYQFLNYILQGEVGADISTQVWYLCPNKAAYEYLPEDFQESLVISTEEIPEGEFIMNVGAEALAVHDEVYTAFKAALD